MVDIKQICLYNINNMQQSVNGGLLRLKFKHRTVETLKSFYATFLLIANSCDISCLNELTNAHYTIFHIEQIIHLPDFSLFHIFLLVLRMTPSVIPKKNLFVFLSQWREIGVYKAARDIFSGN